MTVEDFEREHLNVLMEAHEIFVQKSKVRGQMWLNHPPSDKIREIGERAERMANALPLLQTGNIPRKEEIREIIIEDALDVINYADFLIKLLRRGDDG